MSELARRAAELNPILRDREHAFYAHVEACPTCAAGRPCIEAVGLMLAVGGVSMEITTGA